MTEDQYKNNIYDNDIEWNGDGDRTWPPTTAIEGNASQRVGKALSSPWSPSAVHALCILLTNEIRFSIRAWIGESARERVGRGEVSELTRY